MVIYHQIWMAHFHGSTIVYVERANGQSPTHYPDTADLVDPKPESSFPKLLMINGQLILSKESGC